MIVYVEDDLFASHAKVLVNAVNTVGVMGKGVAKEFKTMYPEMFEKYREYCNQGHFNIGELWLYKNIGKMGSQLPYQAALARQVKTRVC